MSRKVREYKDYLEVGAYLAAVHLALVHSRVRLGRMYPKNGDVARKIGRVERALRELRSDLDNRWVRDLTSDGGAPAEDRAEPIYGHASREALSEAHEAMDALHAEGSTRDLERDTRRIRARCEREMKGVLGNGRG